MTGDRAHRLYSVVVFIVLASLDNVAIGLVPPLYDPIGEHLGVPEAALGAVTAVSYLISAVAAVGWAYVGDRTNRKPLLMIGTLLWAAGTGGTALADSYLAFFAAQAIGAIGLGAVGSVGFSVVSDLITPRRRGLVMSFWGLSQGVGTVAGTLLGGVLGAADWRRPFLLLAVVGVVATAAYLFTYDIRRGQSEPELAA
ncbi:MAG TPA: MFS transporter, partial [Micromonosporaceae bacterium]|nr:MFS transporter [Micromonosporaceae bacterium]